MIDVLLLFGEIHCLPVHDNIGRDGPIPAFQKPLSSMLHQHQHCLLLISEKVIFYSAVSTSNE